MKGQVNTYAGSGGLGSAYPIVYHNLLIYSLGNEYFPITIGASGGTANGSCWGNKKSQSLDFDSSTGNGGWAAFYTDSTINLTEYSQLYFLTSRLVCSNAGNWGLGFGSSTGYTSWCSGNRISSSSVFNKQLLSLDIASYNAAYYVGGYADQTTQTFGVFLISETADNVAKLGELAGIANATKDLLCSNANLLLSKSSAVNFMLNQCTGDFMIQALQNPNFLNAINASQFRNKIVNSETWGPYYNLLVSFKQQ